jgi:erythromycin esterase
LRAEAAKASTDAARESRRDAWNADNLRWLAERRFAGRKIIVWAHNVHVMHGFYAPDFKALHEKAQAGDMTTTGFLMKQWLGAGAYAIGITAFQGEEGFAMGGPRTPIAPAPDGSLEAQLHALGHPFAFLNLQAPGLPGPLLVRAPKFDVNTVADLAAVYDGLIFVDQMQAPKRI